MKWTLACLAGLFGCAAAIADQPESDYPYTPVPFTQVKVDGGFWGPRMPTNRKVTVWYDFKKCEDTGKRNLLDVAIKNADLVCKTFGPGEGQLIDVPGHEEIEIGLVKLYRLTGDEKYLRQARFFIDMRGRKDKRGKTYGPYCQDHKPLVDQTEAVGHAVRGGYLYAGVADVAALTGDRDYIRAIDRIWQDVVDRKLYLIASVGQHGAGEGYAGAWKLDNLRAYNETCAAIALALWNHRMFGLHGDAKYIDVLERILYNGFLAGVSLSGDTFFYPNPLACDMKFKFNHGSLQRSPWFDCSCCPVNVVRFLPSIPGMVYAGRGDSAYVNLFVQGRGEITLPFNAVTITQQTNYPWSGKVRLTVTPQKTGSFALHVRIPGWAMNRPIPGDLYRIAKGDIRPWEVCWKVNGKVVSESLEMGYAVIRRDWKAGDVVELDLPMGPQRVLAHEKVEPNTGRTAVVRGPIVYCIEGADHDGRVLNIYLPDDAKLTAKHRADLLGGMTVLAGKGRRARREDDGSVASESVELTMIPYYAWCHRGANEMQVWIPRTRKHARVAPLPTIASRSRAGASHCHRGDAVVALNDRKRPEFLPPLGGPVEAGGGTAWPAEDRAVPELLEDRTPPEHLGAGHLQFVEQQLQPSRVKPFGLRAEEPVLQASGASFSFF